LSQDILVVDDEVGIRELLSEILRDEGYRVRVAADAVQARDARNESRPDLVLLDIWMPGTDGITLLKEWGSAGMLTMPVVMMSGHGTVETAAEATRLGAFDFLQKPIALPKLLDTVERALAKGKADFQPGLTFVHLGKSSIMLDMRKRLDLLANRAAPILFVGEVGAGAELAARYLHRSNAPWIAPFEVSWLAENPFTVLTEAQDGTLFLNDISKLDRSEQKGLGQLVTKLDRHNVRLLAFSSVPPSDLLQQGSFDAETLARLSQIVMPMPALREHQDDIPDIATVILVQLVEAKEVPFKTLSVGALNALRSLSWPGNLPALANAIRTLALSSFEAEISVEEVNRIAPQFTKTDQPNAFPLEFDLPLREARDLFEQAYFAHHIQAESGNMSRVAERVGLERTHLYRKLKQLGMRTSGKDE
jgi:two-component system, NtrC family, nitrogen regulation response regulator NtrX